MGERDQSADVCLVSSGKHKGEPESDPFLRDSEVVPFGWGGAPKDHCARDETITKFYEVKVKPHVSDAWVDFGRTKVGFEIPFTRHFYSFTPPRPLDEIDGDLNRVVIKIMDMLREVEK